MVEAGDPDGDPLFRRTEEVWMLRHAAPHVHTPYVRIAGRFEVHRRIGVGGMGTVYRGFDTKLQRPVALKLLRIDGDDDTRHRLEHEARCAARINHPHVVTAYDVFASEHGLVFAMELIAGESAQTWGARASWRDKLSVYVKAGRGLLAAHEAGVLHGDFKPSNVLVGPRHEVVKVVDFGIARVLAGRLRDDDWIGTLVYMAPERLARREYDARADQFSYCAALWWQLGGELPFVTRGEDGLVLGLTRPEQVAELDVLSPPIPLRLQRILERGLSFHDEARYPSMVELLRELEDVPEAIERRRRRWGVGLVGTAALVGLPWVGAMWSERWGPPSRLNAVEASSMTEPASPPSLELAIELARAGEPAEAWHYFRTVDEREAVDIEQALVLATELIEVAPTLTEREAHVAYAMAERVARRARWRAIQDKHRDAERRAYRLEQEAVEAQPRR